MINFDSYRKIVEIELSQLERLYEEKILTPSSFEGYAFKIAKNGNSELKELLLRYYNKTIKKWITKIDGQIFVPCRDSNKIYIGTKFNNHLADFSYFRTEEFKSTLKTCLILKKGDNFKTITPLDSGFSNKYIKEESISVNCFKEEKTSGTDFDTLLSIDISEIKNLMKEESIEILFCVSPFFGGRKHYLENFEFYIFKSLDGYEYGEYLTFKNERYYNAIFSSNWLKIMEIDVDSQGLTFKQSASVENSLELFK